MKSLLISVYALFVTVCLGQTIPDSALYLGQTPPGNTPKIFQLPVSSGLFAAERIAISPDGKEIYYSELNNYPASTLRIKYFRYFNNQWNGPFNLFEGYMAPGLSLSGDTLFFEKYQSGGGTFYTYFSVRNDTTWSSPLKFMLGNQLYKHYLQITNSGNYYLSSNPPGSIGGLDWCRLVVNNSDTIIQSLGLPLNTSSNNADFYIAKDESFIILPYQPTANRSCYGYIDFFITYRKNDGTWTNPKNLGTTINVNNPSDGRWGPYVTIDNKYLFYSRGITVSDTRINWIRIDNLIDSLKHTNFVPYVINPIPNQTATKNSSFNYQIPDSTFIDDDGNNTISYAATLSNGKPLPAWLHFEPSTQIFSGVPDTAAAFYIKVTATDTAKASVSCTFSIISVLTGVNQGENKLPKDFHLEQNYPNPFNPSTTIQYSLSKASQTKLIIYNLLGQKIRTLIDAFQNAGDYSTVWDGMDDTGNAVTSGVYFYCFQTGELNLLKKMLLLR